MDKPKIDNAEQQYADLKLIINGLDSLCLSMALNIDKKSHKHYAKENITPLIERLNSAYSEINTIRNHLGIPYGI